MEVKEILFQIRKSGCELFVGDDGAVHGRMRPGHKLPLDVRPLVDELRLHNAEAVELLEAERVETMNAADPAAREWWKQAVDSGAIELAAPIMLESPEAKEAKIIFRDGGGKHGKG